MLNGLRSAAMAATVERACMQSRCRAATSAGHSSGTRRGRQLPRCVSSLFVMSSHRATPYENVSAWAQQ